MLAKSNNSRLEKFGKTITFCCMSLIVFVVALILIFVAQKGLSTFFVNKVNVFSFLFGSTWNHSKCSAKKLGTTMASGLPDTRITILPSQMRAQAVAGRSV